jgi:hypothetical protein
LSFTHSRSKVHFQETILFTIFLPPLLSLRPYRFWHSGCQSLGKKSDQPFSKTRFKASPCIVRRTKAFVLSGVSCGPRQLQQDPSVFVRSQLQEDPSVVISCASTLTTGSAMGNASSQLVAF